MTSWMFVALIAMIWLPSCALIWYAFSVVHRVADVGTRFRASERHDNNAQTQKLLEKLYSGDQVATAKQHGNERIHQAQADTQVELEAMRRNHRVPMPMPEARDDAGDQPCAPADSVHQ